MAARCFDRAVQSHRWEILPHYFKVPGRMRRLFAQLMVFATSLARGLSANCAARFASLRRAAALEHHIAHANAGQAHAANLAVVAALELSRWKIE